MAVDAEHIMSLAKNAKLHRELCMKVVIVIHKVLKIFPQVEAQKPRCNIGLQNLSATHIALDKAKLLIEQCADCSKLYLAVTGEAVLGKFERIKNSLAQSLRTLESMIPQKLGKQIAEIVKDLQTTKLELKPSEKEISNELIILLQRYSRDKVDPLQLEVFQQAAVKLGLQSKTAVLTERRALNRLAIEASEKEDEKKEAIINYFLELLSLHAKFSYDNVEDDTRSQASSMTEGHSGGNISLLPESSFSPRGINSPSRMLPTPSEFKCPISLQLMFDPVVIASGQTYERSCIEKWFKEGHDSCPKTQQSLPHLNVTPNYCIKGLIASWCEKNGIKFRNSAAQSHTWHHSMCMADLESMTDQVDNSVREIEGGLSEGEDASNLKAEGNNVVSGDLGSRMNSYPKKVEDDSDWTENCDSKTDLTSCFKELEKNDYSELDQLLTKLAAPLLESQLEAVEKIKVLAENTKTCFYIGECGMIPPLVNLLQSVLDASDLEAQQVVTLALRNISKNDRNKEIMSSAGALPLLLNLIRSGRAEEATLVLLELSILDNEKHAFVSCEAIPLLFELLESENSQCAQHALGILCNLSTIIGQWTNILSDMEMEILVTLLSDDETRPKVIKIINHLAGLEAGRALIAETEGCILAIVESLDTEELEEQDHGLDTVFLLCTNRDDHSQLVLREGVIPALVNISVNGSIYGKDKAQKLLELFREQRTRELSWTSDQSSCDKEVSFNHHLGHAETREEIVAQSPRRGTKRRSVVSSLHSFCCSCNKNP